MGGGLERKNSDEKENGKGGDLSFGHGIDEHGRNFSSANGRKAEKKKKQ